MSLANLAGFATKATASGKPSFFGLTIEAAREAVVIRDSRKPVNVVEGAPVPLSLYAGKIRMDLDAIADGATAVTVPVDQVVDVTSQLKEALTNGDFDEAIIAAQTKGREAAEKAAATKAAGGNTVTASEEVEGEAPSDVDVDDLG